jgi:hypothetical protein
MAIANSAGLSIAGTRPRLMMYFSWHVDEYRRDKRYHATIGTTFPFSSNATNDGRDAAIVPA